MVGKAFCGALFLLAVLGALLFVPAGTWNYPAAWIYLAVFALSVLWITVYLFRTDAKLLESRLHVGLMAEQEASQKVIQSISGLCGPGLTTDFTGRRFLWVSVSCQSSLSCSDSGSFFWCFGKTPIPLR